MKTALSLLITNLLAISLFSQELLHVANEDYNHLIPGLNNRIKIEFNSKDALNIEGIVENAIGCVWINNQIEHKNDNKCDIDFYVFIGEKNYNQEFCTLKFKNKKTGKIIKNIKFKVVDGILGLENNKISDGKISLEDMKKERRIISFLSDRNFQVNQFSIVLTNPTAEPTALYINKGETFDENVIDLIKSAKPGAVIQIFDVKGRMKNDCKDRKMASMTFVII